MTLFRLFFVSLDQNSGPIKNQGFAKTQTIFSAKLRFLIPNLDEVAKTQVKSPKKLRFLNHPYVKMFQKTAQKKKAC